MKIWGNTLVKNEDRYIWFAVSSVINYLDKLLIWDTGSIDKTVEIIKLLQKKYPGKILFKEYGEVDENGFTKARQEMLKETKSDWLFLLDGDEVWWKKSIISVKETIDRRGGGLNALVNPFINLVGDIYHYQDERAGSYHILDKKGFVTIRAINRKIPELHVDRPYGSEGFFGKNNTLIQNLDDKKLLYLDAPFLHFTHLQRSGDDERVMQRGKKLKYELGNNFSKDFKYPEVFYQNYPDIIDYPWRKRSGTYLARSFIETPLKKIKRNFNDK